MAPQNAHHRQSLRIMGRLTAGQREIKAIAGALARLPQRVVWKLSAQEIDRAGGLAALSLSPNIKASAWPVITHV